MLMWILEFLVAGIAVLYVYLHLQALKFKKLDSIPGPKGVPLLGNALEFTNDSRQVFEKIQQLLRDYGPRTKIWIGPTTVFLLMKDPKDIEVVLSSNKFINKGSVYKHFAPWLGDGLLLSTGLKWRKNRKIITPAFHFKILEQFIEVFNSASDVMIENFESEVDRESTDIYPYVTLCALDAICETAMGISVNAQKNSDSEYVKAVREMCNVLTRRSFSAIKTSDLFFYLSEDGRLHNKLLNILHGMTNSVIKARKEVLKNEDDFNIETFEGGKRKLAFLDVLLLSKLDGQRIPDNVIREEVDTFMFEGHDTTASAITFSLYALANHPEIQKKAMAELDEIFGGDRSKVPSYRDLQDMKYLEAVIKETLRLYPSVPMIVRQLQDDLDLNGRIIPKGTNLTLFFYSMQRSPEYFTDPLKFNPERFLNNDEKPSTPFSYVPFSAGARNCIGQKFAMLELKSTVSKVLRHFELLPIEDEPILTFEVILKAQNGVHIKLKRRK